MENIRNKIIFIFIFVAVLSTGIFAMVYLVKKGNSVISPAKLELASETELQPPFQEEKPQSNAEPAEEAPEFMTMDTDYFTLVLPPAWKKSSEGDTLPVIIADSSEEAVNEKAKEINFHTNLSINSTSLGEASLKDYVENVKTSLIQTILIIEITKEERAEINGSDVYILEIKSIQQDLNFETVLAIFAGKDNTVWAFSFNTIEESWPDYKDVFYGIIDSIKKK